jgi:hypothetical protein
MKRYNSTGGFTLSSLLAIIVFGGTFLLLILMLGRCSLTPSFELINASADNYIAKYNTTATQTKLSKISCNDRDLDGNGYATCTFLVTNEQKGTEVTEDYECSSVTYNDGCKKKLYAAPSIIDQ